MLKKYREANYEHVRERERIAAAKFRKTVKWRLMRYRARDAKRRKIFAILGDKCARCGFADKRALQMDHINGRNGEAKLGNIDRRWAYVRDNPKEAKLKYQILCANCNFIKRDENDEHYYHGKEKAHL